MSLTKTTGWLRGGGWILAGLPLILGLAACSTTSGRVDDEAPADLKLACGQVCLRNGESCSEFFGKRNAETRMLFEQAKQNYWICLRKYPGAEAGPRHPCIAPAPLPETFDDCGQQLDHCLLDCGTTLEEMSRVTKQKETSRQSGKPPDVSAK